MSEQGCQHGESNDTALVDRKSLIKQATILCDQVNDLHAQTSFLLAAVDAMFADLTVDRIVAEPVHQGLRQGIRSLILFGGDVKSSAKELKVVIKGANSAF